MGRDDGAESIYEPNRKRIPIELSLSGFNGCDDDKDRIQYPKRDQNRNAYEEDAENHGNSIVNQHRDLKVKGFLSICVYFRRVAAFHEPNDERSENVAKEMKKQSEQCAGVAENTPRADIG